MPSRFPPACESSPAPAVVVWGADGVVAWELNHAARHWAPTLHWTPGEWASLAQGVLQGAQAGAAEGDCPMLRLRWRAAVFDGAWVAWLLPLGSAPASGDPADSEARALGDQVARLTRYLHVVEDVGRLGVWEHDIRHGRGWWDASMYRFFGFDPARQPPRYEKVLQRIHPDDRERLRRAYYGSMEKAGRYDERFRLPRAYGGIALAHIVWEVWNGPDGTPERLIGVMLDDTESVAAAQRNQAATTQLALAVGLVGISLWRIDLATQRIKLNDWGYELIGQMPQPDGMPVDLMRDAIHPDDSDKIIEAARQAMLGPGVVDTEARYRRPDGSYRTLLTRRIAERDEQGRAVALVGVSLDVTEQVAERERARHIAQSIDLIAEATGVGVWSTDAQTNETVWNGQMRRIYDLPEDMPIREARRVAVARTHPDDRARLDAAYHRLAEGEGVPEDMEFRVQRPDGELRRIVGRARSALLGERRVLFGVFIDVTEQRATEERLRLAEQRAMLAAQSVGLAIWERDLVGGDTWWDPQMYRLRGLRPDEPRTPNELRHTSIHPDDLAFVERRTLEIIERETDYNFEFRVRWPDGTVRWLATRGTVMRDENGRALRILGFNWDITEHKHSEDIRRQKAAAEEASRAKSEFLSRMSHELRTPLNAVLGFAQLMLDDPTQMLAGKQRERTQRIREAGLHLLALIDDVLDLTSVEIGSVPVQLQPVPLAPLVQDMLQWFAATAQQNGVSLVPGALDGAVMADARRMRQIVANLLSNAIKYNRRGGRVEVGLVDPADSEQAEQWLGFRVRDNGRGLTATQMQRLFEPFNRLGAEREGIEGTGIGLTIVRALVEHMGGRIEVESHAGVGSDFRIWLPRAEPAAALSSEAPKPAPALAAPAPAEAIDVLYIEDNPINVMLVSEIVTMRPNVRLHTAIDGRSGIARARELHPRAVLIDLQLPDIDGFAVLHALRADASLDGLVCIALSANAMPEDIARAKRIGFDDYWTKPIDLPQFLGGLDRLAQPPR